MVCQLKTPRTVTSHNKFIPIPWFTPVSKYPVAFETRIIAEPAGRCVAILAYSRSLLAELAFVNISPGHFPLHQSLSCRFKTP
jgi:hypothetical protein